MTYFPSFSKFTETILHYHLWSVGTVEGTLHTLTHWQSPLLQGGAMGAVVGRERH